MKQVLIIGGISTALEDVEEIRDYAAGVQQTVDGVAQVQGAHLDGFYFVLAPGDYRIFDTKNDRPLEAYDLVILRSKMRTYGALAYCLSKFCQAKGVRHFNDYSQYFNGGKLAQAVLFYELGLPFLKTVYALDQSVLLAALAQELTFPCILKDTHGAHGRSNYLVHSMDEARAVLEGEPHIQFIAQEFCPNDKDYRVLVLDDTHLVFERAGAPGTHLNNTSQGAQAQLTPEALTPEILDQAHAVARAMKLAMAGVDVMPNRETGEHYFLEVNSQPQLFTGALLPEKATHFKQFVRKYL